MAVNFTRQSPTWEDGHTVLAEDAERWEQLGADVDAWSAGVPVADLAIGGRNPGALAMPGSRYLRAYSANRVDDSGFTTQNRLTFVPALVGATNTFPHVYTNVNVAAAGSVVRLGIYTPNATTGRPDALLQEFGTVASTSTGIKILTLGTAITLNPGLYWLAGVIQGGAVNTGRYVDSGGTNGIGASLFGDMGVDSGSSQAYGYPYQNSVTGALPANATITAYAEIAVVVALRTA